MTKGQAKCTHCGGDLIKDEDGRKCLQCGRTWHTLPELGHFYEDHKTEILHDLAEMGRPKTRKKWQIPDSTMVSLLYKWIGEKPPAPPPAPVITGNHTGPELPGFSNDWSPEVQIKWLEVWAIRR